MNCGRQQCKRTFRGPPLYCRCSLEFCSEACFVSGWHAEHQQVCPRAEEIKQELEARRARDPVERSGMAQLVGAALSRTPPSSSPSTAAVSFSPPKPAPSSSTSTPAVSSSAPRASQVKALEYVLNVCPQAEKIKQELEARRLKDPGNTAQLVGAASSQKTPSTSTLTSAASDSQPSAHVADLKGDGAVTASQSAGPATSAGQTANCVPSASKGLTSEAPSRTIRRFKFEDFVIGEAIGNGSYGQVHKAVHSKTQEVFAMKAVPKKKVLEHQMTSYLTREVRTQIVLTHPGILRLYYYFEDVDNVHLLLEYANGGSLFSWLRRQSFIKEPEAASYFVDVAAALDHLHRHGIVHRDIKPENILLCVDATERKAKLADFGWCAELSRDGAPRHTFCGTWDYLSPEMVQSEPHDRGVDVWATGVLLYEMLTGKPPFAASNQVKVMNRIIKVDLQVPDTVSSMARDLIQKLLVREPQRRLSLKEAARHSWVILQLPSKAIELSQAANPPEISAPSAVAAAPPPQAPSDKLKRAETSQASPPEPDSKERKGSIAHLSSPCNSLACPEAPPCEASSNKAGSARSTTSQPYKALSDGKPRSSGSSGDATTLCRPKPSVMPWSSSTHPLSSALRSKSASHADEAPEAVSQSYTSAHNCTGEEVTPVGSRWQDTDTFAAIRRWVRSSPVAVSTVLGSELDRTLSAVKVNSSSYTDEDIGSSSAFAAKNVADGKVIPQPKRRATSAAIFATEDVLNTQKGLANPSPDKESNSFEDKTASQGWAGIKNDWENLTGAFQGQLDQLIRRLESPRVEEAA